MERSEMEEFESTEERRKLLQQERVILEVTELVCELMQKDGTKKSELAERLGRSKGYVTQLLDGRANMTLRTISDVLCALRATLHVSAQPLDTDEEQSSHQYETIVCSWPRGGMRAGWQDSRMVDRTGVPPVANRLKLAS
ncbi:MAG TPA: hypothetical protein VMZ31_16885 [Phycisphaerae bacterium]|nr:hypothetical protein [Phycisphaerae bacterium]